MLVIVLFSDSALSVLNVLVMRFSTIRYSLITGRIL